MFLSFVVPIDFAFSRGSNEYYWFLWGGGILRAPICVFFVCHVIGSLFDLLIAYGRPLLSRLS
uniref:Putative ovule protein n=1 Tax=Solanum chacoense TaxID=4108 RepID=A0A0V0HEK5_SOLCH